MTTRTQRLVAFLLALLVLMSVCCTALAKYRTIPFGEVSDDVRDMQRALKSKGYYKGSIDGKFGQKTRSAVYRYQKAIGLKGDGKPGDRTLTALYHGTSAINDVNSNKTDSTKPKNPSTLCYGCTGARVRQLQRALKVLGYFKGSIDGKFGEMTELAVRKFQTARKLHVDGMVGKDTLASINRAQKKVRVGSSFLLAVGSRGEEVKTLQAGLRNRGYKISDSNGYFGSSTSEALKSYQRSQGISATGTMSQSQYNSFIKQKVEKPADDSGDSGDDPYDPWY